MAPSDGSGVYSLDSGYLATTGGTITISQHNPVLEDIRDALTARIMASGVRPMTGPLKLADGTAGAPSLTFSNAATQGFYKTTSGIGVSIGGTKVGEWLSTGLELSSIGIIAGTSFSDLAAGDTLPAYDVSATANKRILISDFFKVINALTADGSPSSANDYVVTYDASATAAKKVLLQNLPAIMPRGYIDGCIMANGADATNDITFTAGVCRDSTNAANITVAAMATGKQLDANWAPGDAAGMRDSSAGIANGTYHIYAVSKADGTQDIYAHTSTTVATVITALQAETGGSSYIYARLIGSIVRVSNSIKAFIQDGDYFNWVTPTLDINDTATGTSAVTRTLSVPIGVRLLAFINMMSTASSTYLSALDQTDAAPVVNATPLGSIGASSADTNGSTMQIRTNASGQIRSRSIGNTTLRIVTTGYVHPRGKNA